MINPIMDDQTVVVADSDQKLRAAVQAFINQYDNQIQWVPIKQFFRQVGYKADVTFGPAANTYGGQLSLIKEMNGTIKGFYITYLRAENNTSGRLQAIGFDVNNFKDAILDTAKNLDPVSFVMTDEPVVNDQASLEAYTVTIINEVINLLPHLALTEAPTEQLRRCVEANGAG